MQHLAHLDQHVQLQSDNRTTPVFVHQETVSLACDIRALLQYTSILFCSVTQPSEVVGGTADGLAPISFHLVLLATLVVLAALRGGWGYRRWLSTSSFPPCSVSQLSCAGKVDPCPP